MYFCIHDITSSVECFAGQACAVDVLKGGVQGTDDPLCCSYYAQQGLLAASVPHNYAAGQNALYHASVEGAHGGVFQFAEEEKVLLSFLGQ